ncbi:hypothetical protein BCR37DRAFT_377292 [Protomyces lactucae-debilis]|uniref:Polycystin cation channel PKD1/PKD2 domain-containing protein n=1 Tax=Protomyces lactucae-debilis TaxID=2754530 RepID=A0A1Y2FNN1_PROLT|nr:uncharacterized protein BCR37DRAFT_377292 [Protomyces lactucae-debilis]ORY85602.1 hypothetical protein BCR37DRAFT_377292 [Protomyces lactucae-debilis]
MDAAMNAGERESLLNAETRSCPDAHTVTQIARKIRYLIQELLPIQVKESHITNPKSRIVTEGVLDLCEKAGEELPGCVVFATLFCAQHFKRLCVTNLPDADVNSLRQVAAEVIAKRLIERITDTDFLLSEALLRRYSICKGGEDTVPKSALETAVDFHFTRVVACNNAQMVVDYLWNGAYLVKYDEDDSSRVAPYSAGTSTNFWRHFQISRVTVPRYQHLITMFFNVCFLALYTATINTANDSGEIDAAEIAMWLFVLSYLLEELSRAYKVGKAYLSFWTATNLFLYSVFTAALILRIVAVNLHDHDQRSHLIIVSYRTLSAVSPIMWMRFFVFFSSWNQTCGLLLICLQAMLVETIAFSWFALVVIIGFLQAFLGFDEADGTVDALKSILHTIVQGTLGSPDFDFYKGSFAIILYYIFSFLIGTIMLGSILVALFAQAYSNVYENSVDEYLALRTQRLLEFIRAPDENVFCAPLNLIELFLLPFELVFSQRFYNSLSKRVMFLLYWPFLVLIALYESRVLAYSNIVADQGDFNDDDWGDEIDEQTADWQKVVEKGLPAAESDMEILLELRDQIKELEEKLSQLQERRG